MNKVPGKIRAILHAIAGLVLVLMATYTFSSDNVSGLLSKSFAPPYWQPLVGMLLLAGGALLCRDSWRPLAWYFVATGYALPAVAFYIVSLLHH